MNSKVRLSSIISRYPEVEDLLSQYHIDDVDEDTLHSMRIEDFCDTFDIDLEDFLMDLEETITESRNTEWLSRTSGDQWEDGSDFSDEYEETTTRFENELGFDSEDNDYDDS